MLTPASGMHPSFRKAVILSAAFVGVAALLSRGGPLPYSRAETLAGSPTYAGSAARPRPARLARLPQVMLWAWERPEDLRFLDPRRAGVAFLARTIYLSTAPVNVDRISIRPRLQPLRVPQGTPLVAVVRIETDSFYRRPAAQVPAPSKAQREQTVAAIAALRSLPEVVAIQIDFDAASSERPFYAALLREVREQLPDSLPLSITALASWCLGDNWLDGLPIDEAVPMLFRMGSDGPEVRLRLAAGQDFRARPCQQSLGISTDEPLPGRPPGRRVYVFHPRPWTAAVAAKVFKEVSPWP